MEVLRLMSLRETFVYTGHPVVFNELQDKLFIAAVKYTNTFWCLTAAMNNLFIL